MAVIPFLGLKQLCAKKIGDFSSFSNPSSKIMINLEIEKNNVLNSRRYDEARWQHSFN